MTKIKILNDRIIFDGHADTRQECETITLMCDNLAKSKDFKTIRYESGYAEFEKVGKTEELKFPPASQNVNFIFDNTISSILLTAGSTNTSNNLPATITESGGSSIYFGSALHGDPDQTTAICALTIADGYELDTINVTVSEGSLGSASNFIISNKTSTGFTFLSSADDTTWYTVTLTTKAIVQKQTIDVSTLAGWANLSTGNHQITIKTKASGYADSAASNAVTVNKKPETTLQYCGTATKLSVARCDLASTTVGNYALFGGGRGSSESATVDAYNTSLIRTIPTGLSVARHYLAATSIGNYALFGGGRASNSYYKTVDAYDTSLTRTIPTELSITTSSLAATTVGNYALFGGGIYYSSTEYSNKTLAIVNAYDTSLTRTIPIELSQKRYSLAATTVGNYALFGGGYRGSNVDATVDAYDTSLTRTIPTALSQERYRLAATTVGNYALFGGGSTLTTTVDAYDTSLTRTIPTGLSVKRSSLVATTVGNYALFGAGSGSNSILQSTVDAYDTSLTRTIPTGLSQARHYLAATTVGNYALFGGGSGRDYSPIYSVVDVYTVA